MSMSLVLRMLNAIDLFLCVSVALLCKAFEFEIFLVSHCSIFSLSPPLFVLYALLVALVVVDRLLTVTDEQLESGSNLERVNCSVELSEDAELELGYELHDFSEVEPIVVGQDDGREFGKLIVGHTVGGREVVERHKVNCQPPCSGGASECSVDFCKGWYGLVECERGCRHVSEAVLVCGVPDLQES